MTFAVCEINLECKFHNRRRIGNIQILHLYDKENETNIALRNEHLKLPPNQRLASIYLCHCASI